MAALNGNVLFSPMAELIALEGLDKGFVNREERQVSLSPTFLNFVPLRVLRG